MASYTIPLNPTASQEVKCTLSATPCRLWVRQLATGLYLDLWFDEKPLIMGAQCLNNVDLIRNPASPLQARLYFADTQGSDDPDYSAIGSRFFLYYENNTP